MKSLIAIIKKEFARFFRDRRMLLTTIVMPFALMYIVYALMGSLISSLTSTDTYTVVVRNMSEYAGALFEQTEVFEITEAAEDDEYYKEQVESGSLDIYVVFPENFDQVVGEVISGTIGSAAGVNVEIYYNSSEDSSYAAYTAFAEILNAFESSISNVFDINSGGNYDLSTTSATSYILGAIVPMVVLVLLFSGCMAVAPESIAGEKERGTFATMLVTPVSRTHIAVGKLISLSCISLLSGVSGFLGLILSLPNILQGVFEISDLSVFGVGHYFMILGVMLVTVLLFVAAVSCISALAKSVKEANSYIGPLNVVVMLVGLLTMFAGNAASAFLYLIPVYNSAMLLTDIMSLAVTPLNFILTLVSNVVYVCVLVFVLTKMFKSERIMFNS